MHSIQCTDLLYLCSLQPNISHGSHQRQLKAELGETDGSIIPSLSSRVTSSAINLESADEYHPGFSLILLLTFINKGNGATFIAGTVSLDLTAPTINSSLEPVNFSYFLVFLKNIFAYNDIDK